MNGSCCILSKLCYYSATLKALIRITWAGVLALALCSGWPLRADTVGTNHPVADIHITPGPEDGKIAFATAYLLEHLNFSHHKLDAAYANDFLDFYLEALDPQHLHFLQSDLNDFARYRTNLDRMTINRQQKADVTPAFDIFARFIDRLKQRVQYQENLLQTEKFKFDSDERVVLNRHEMPYPKDIDEAHELWRQRLRAEYLQEKLGLEDAEKNSPATNSVKSIHEQIVETLQHRYQRTLRLFADWNNQDVMGVYLTALAHVYDPHSDYFDAEQLQQFTINMNLALFGIGAELRSDDEGYCRIERLLPGGPAEKSKLVKPGDRIVAVAQSNQPPVDVVDMSINKAVQLIRGPKGTEVRLSIIPEHASSPRTDVSLVRDEISLGDQAAKGKIIEMPDNEGQTNRIGVIDLPSFYAPMGPGSRSGDSTGEYTSVDVAKLLKKFKREHVSGVILNLRYNGGGSLEEAIRLAGLFIKDGPIVQVKASDGRIITAPDPDPTSLYDGPLIVLTSRFSASASEIVAAALQDYGRALVVGDISTHGKGTVQSVNYLTNYIRLDDPEKDNPGALKVTVQKFYRINGVSTQLKGVMPDIVLPSVLNYSKDIGESSLQHPLECDSIPGAEYEKFDLVQPYLGELLKRSNERISTNAEFAYIREDIERFRRKQEDKTVSLNEKQRLKEVQEDAARDKQRKKERLARPEPNEKAYTITLQQADKPGLPEPDQKTNSIVLKGYATTNLTASVTNPRQPIEVEDENAPTPDPVLDEASHILEDYISLLEKHAMLTVNRIQ